jgi:hypothetical protein
MSNSTATFDSINSTQASKEITANAYFDAASPATLYGRRASTSTGLTWGYYGGNVLINGSVTQIANSTLTLTASTTTYIEAEPTTGAVSANTTGYTAGRWPLYTVVVGTSTVTSYTDYRLATPPVTGRLSLSVAGGANVTLTAAQAANDILEFTGAITANINVVVPTQPQQWTVFNNTTGAFTLTVKTNAGTGIVVASTKRAILYSDGTNVVRVTADA